MNDELPELYTASVLWSETIPSPLESESAVVASREEQARRQVRIGSEESSWARAFDDLKGPAAGRYSMGPGGMTGWIGKRRAAALTIAAVSCAPLAATASADVNLGSRGGITYVSDADLPSPPEVSVMEAACPAATEVSGGVGSAGTSVESSDVNDTAPADGPDGGSDPDDAWFATANFPDSAFLPNPEVFAICEARSHTHASGSVGIAPGEAGSLTVPCPGPTKPTGGGVMLSGAEADGAFVNSSSPHDGGDRGREPDDGWKGRAYNPEGSAKTMTVTAICRQGALRYDRHVERAGAGDLATPAAGCRVRGPQHLVGVGWRWSGPAGEAELYYASLEDSFDGDDVPDDYVVLGGENKAAPRKKMTGYAICVR